MVFPKFNGGVLLLYGSSDGFLVEAELQVSERVSGFQEIRGRTKMEVHKYGPSSPWYRRELTRFFETTGVCWYFPGAVSLSQEAGERIRKHFAWILVFRRGIWGLGCFTQNKLRSVPWRLVTDSAFMTVLTAVLD